MEILIDTREQLPLWNDAERITMNVGDYTTKLLKGIMHVERKSPNDLYGSLIQGHERFKKEFERAAEQDVKIVVMVECDEDHFYRKSWEGGWRLKVKGNVLAKITHTFKMRRKAEFIWCRDREDMRFKMIELFRAEEDKLWGQHK